MNYGVDLEEWCENCKRVTAHRSETERPGLPSTFLKDRLYCRECGRKNREVIFK